MLLHTVLYHARKKRGKTSSPLRCFAGGKSVALPWRILYIPDSVHRANGHMHTLRKTPAFNRFCLGTCRFCLETELCYDHVVMTNFLTLPVGEVSCRSVSCACFCGRPLVLPATSEQFERNLCTTRCIGGHSSGGPPHGENNQSQRLPCLSTLCTSQNFPPSHQLKSARLYVLARSTPT